MTELKKGDTVTLAPPAHGHLASKTYRIVRMGVDIAWVERVDIPNTTRVVLRSVLRRAEP